MAEHEETVGVKYFYLQRGGQDFMKRFMEKTVVYLLAAALILTVSGCGTRNGSSLSGQDAGNDQNGTTDREEPVSAADTAEPEVSIPEDRAPSGQGGENDSALPDTGVPAVYVTADMSAEGLMSVYEVLDVRYWYWG